MQLFKVTIKEEAYAWCEDAGEAEDFKDQILWTNDSDVEVEEVQQGDHILEEWYPDSWVFTKRRKKIRSLAETFPKLIIDPELIYTGEIEGLSIPTNTIWIKMGNKRLVFCTTRDTFTNEKLMPPAVFGKKISFKLRQIENWEDFTELTGLEKSSQEPFLEMEIRHGGLVYGDLYIDPTADPNQRKLPLVSKTFNEVDLEKLTRASFKDHVVFESILSPNMKKYVWRNGKKNTGIRHMNFVIDGCRLYVSGDLGNNTLNFHSSGVLDIHWLGSIGDLQYLVSKITAADVGNDPWSSDQCEREALKHIRRYIETDQLDADKLGEFEYVADRVCYSKMTWFSFLEDSGYEFFGDQYQEMLHIGDGFTIIHWSIMVALEMMSKQLKEKERERSNIGEG